MLLNCFDGKRKWKPIYLADTEDSCVCFKIRQKLRYCHWLLGLFLLSLIIYFWCWKQLMLCIIISSDFYWCPIAFNHQNSYIQYLFETNNVNLCFPISIFLDKVLDVWNIFTKIIKQKFGTPCMTWLDFRLVTV